MKCEKIVKNHYIAAFLFTLVVSMGLMIASFLMPPKGKIDPSVLKASAEMFMWPTLAFGLKAFNVCKCMKKKAKGEECDEDEI